MPGFGSSAFGGLPELIGGRYRTVERLGRGGMATVYSAVDGVTNERVAVKVMEDRLSDSSLDDSGAKVERFEREARIAAAIDAAHVSRVLSSGVDDRHGPYIVMELLEGEDVGRLVARLGPLRPELALRIVGQACMGLQSAHANGVVHRDVKPSNLFLADTPRGPIVKLLDFGIAKGRVREEPDGSRTLTQTGAVLGSPHYMSPEQAVGAKTVDHSTDIWSLGVVLFKCLSGRTPCDERDPVGQLIVNIVNHAPPSVQDYAPWVSREVADVVARALKQAPRDRYPSAKAMHDAIAAVVATGSLDITRAMLEPMTDAERGDVKPRAPVAFLSASVPGVAREPDATATEAMPARPARRRLGLAVGVVGAVASAGAIWGLAHRAAPRVPPSDLEPPRVSAAAAAPPVPVAAVAASVASPIAPPRRAQVRITPPSAAVDVDGLPSPVTRGSVEVTGDLGTVHRVHLKVGSREATTEVILAEDGARPRVVTLAAGRAPPDAAKPAAVLPAAPAPALAASANKPPPKFDTTFE